MKFAYYFLIFASSITLTGCSGAGWYQEGKSSQDFYYDKNQCEQQALSMYPVIVSAPVYDTNCTTINGITNCSTQSRANSNNDKNILPRITTIDSCIRFKGYI